jgi:hypothetical protein
MIQTYEHRQCIVEMVRQDYALDDPVKPTVLGEPAYEGYDPNSQLTTYPYQMRRQAYQSFLSGAAGFTYGCAMSAPGGAGPLFRFDPEWQRLLDLEGANQVAGVLRSFLEERAWWDLEPCPDAIVDGGTGEYQPCAVAARDGSELLIYYPDRAPATVRLDWGVQGAHELRVQATWFDAARGETEDAGTYTAYAVQSPLKQVSDSFVPPRGWLDGVLVLQRKVR